MTAPLTPEQVADVLDDAADLIEQRGWWHRGSTHMTGEQHCAVGALHIVTGADIQAVGKPLFMDAIGALAAVVGDDLIFPWNDAPGRTKQEVLDAFRAAAKQQRGRSPA